MLTMANRYTPTSRSGSKPQIQIGQTDLLKKIEKLQNKHSGDGVKQRKNSDDDDDDDEDSVFKNLKKSSGKFMKKKEVIEEARPSHSPLTAEESEVDDELEISANDRSSTPKYKSNQRPVSASSSIHSLKHHRESDQRRRSPSKVKFQDDTDEEDQPSTSDDMISKNLVLDINDLEAVTDLPGRKTSNKQRNESIAGSVIDEDSIASSSIRSSPLRLRNATTSNLILSIDDLDKSLSEREPPAKKLSGRKKDKKRPKTPTSVIDTETELGIDNSIHTELDSTKTEEISDEIRTARQNASQKGGIKSYREEFETSLDTTELSRRSKRENKSSARSQDARSASMSEKSHKKDKSRRKDKKKKKNRSSSSTASTVSDDQTSTATLRPPRRREDKITERMTISNAEIQVDPSELLKYTDLFKSMSITPNPSSLLISSLTYLNDSTTLNDLHQLTGYNLINQTYNDLIRMNLNFFKSFLAVQRQLYQQQINSIKPK